MSERVYTTVDKAAWGPGPWQEEPDKIQFRDKATGLPCLVKRGPMGVWCGYVGVPAGHPAYERDYDDVNVSVHGGLTYADHCQAGDEAESICHVPEPGEPDDVWWLGFDCGHGCDLCPRYEASNRRRYEETGDPIWLPVEGWERTYKDVAYARVECTSLAKQLAELAS